MTSIFNLLAYYCISTLVTSGVTIITTNILRRSINYMDTKLEKMIHRVISKLLRKAIKHADDVELGYFNTELSLAMVMIQNLAAKRGIHLPTLGYFHRESEEYSLNKEGGNTHG